MEYQDLFEGHRLSVWTTKVENRWTWSYSIDDGPMVENEGQPNLPEAMVLSEGIDQVRRAIVAREKRSAL